MFPFYQNAAFFLSLELTVLLYELLSCHLICKLFMLSQFCNYPPVIQLYEISIHNSVCTSCFITSCSALHLIHIFSSCSYVLYRQMCSTSSVFLCFLFMISCQASPSFLLSSTTSITVLFLPHSSVSSKLYRVLVPQFCFL